MQICFVFDFLLFPILFFFVFLLLFLSLILFFILDFFILLFILAFSDSPFLIVSYLVHLFGLGKGSTKVVWICLSWLQCIYLAYFNKIRFLSILLRRIFHFPLCLHVLARGVSHSNGAPEKLLSVYGDDLSYSLDRDGFWALFDLKA